MTTQTQDIATYYANLLILQYLQKPKAFKTIQSTVTPVLMGGSDIQFLEFSEAPSSGTFKLNYDGVATSALNWNDSAGTIETALQAILTAPLLVSVDGTIEDGLTFTFSDYTSEVLMLSVSDSTLDTDPVASITTVGAQLPIEVENAFNLIGSSLAEGVQLDVLGKYVGVSRSGFGFNGPITLDDADFIQLIRMAIIRNGASSSLAFIQTFLNQFFEGQVYVFDYANMNMSYLIDSNIGSEGLVQLFVSEGILPRPMAVGLSVIVGPVIDLFFGFVTYDDENNLLATPFNNYDTYDTSWIWVSYSDAVPS